MQKLKNILLLFFTVFALGLAIPKSVSAICEPKPVGIPCLSGIQVQCTSGSLTYCCSITGGGCSQLPQLTPIPTTASCSTSTCNTLPCCNGFNEYRPNNSLCVCLSTYTAAPLPTFVNGPDWTNCDGGKGFETAIGCIPIAGDNDGSAIASFFLKWGLGIAGGIALILIV